MATELEASLRAGESRWSYCSTFKRWLDWAMLVLTLPAVLPLGLVIALLIKLDSRGPALIQLKRLGQWRTTFYKYKFRSMVVNAEEALQKLLKTDETIRQEYLATYKIQNDPRVTRFGRLLRRTSLDELPQVFNIVRGEMSWVGPRDILESELSMYGEYAEKLVTVKPGLTGLWQVAGRSRLSYAERIRLDMHYIDHHSLLLDLRILLKTVPIVLLGDGAV